MDLIGTIIAGLGGLAGLGGFIGMFLMYRANRRKTMAEASHSEASAADTVANAAGKVTSIASDWMKEFSERVDRLENEVIALHGKITDLNCENEKLKNLIDKALKRIEALMRGIKILIEQLEGNHIQPAWRPDEWKLGDDEPNG